jgi:hypothetical protein
MWLGLGLRGLLLSRLSRSIIIAHIIIGAVARIIILWYQRFESFAEHIF